jgi:hypothetical protein
MSKHTPGPWRTEIDGELVGPLGGFMPVGGGCYGSPWMTGITEEARKADARLIAAAPELLEALRSMLEDDDHDEAKRKARAAIAKAEGGGNG